MWAAGKKEGRIEFNPFFYSNLHFNIPTSMLTETQKEEVHPYREIFQNIIHISCMLTYGGSTVNRDYSNFKLFLYADVNI
jgi:hypothetical protein